MKKEILKIRKQEYKNKNQNAIKRAQEENQKLKEERRIEIYEYIEDENGVTASQISKALGIDRTYIRNVVNEMIDEGLILIDNKVINGRNNKFYRVRTFLETEQEIYELKKDLKINFDEDLIVMILSD